MTSYTVKKKVDNEEDSRVAHANNDEMASQSSSKTDGKNVFQVEVHDSKDKLLNSFLQLVRKCIWIYLGKCGPLRQRKIGNHLLNRIGRNSSLFLVSLC